MDVVKEYFVKPSANGGVVIESVGETYKVNELVGAFTTPADMITWLAKQYGLNSHPTAIPATEKPTDEGWTEWGGGSRPIHGGLMVIVRLRDGSEHPNERADRFDWTWRDPHHARDIVAYRTV